jgi:hypothetical protein
MERSKYVQYERRRVLRHARSLSVQGSFEDRNKYFTCWWCGFEFKIDRDANGNPEKDGLYYTVKIFPSEIPKFGFTSYAQDMTPDQIALNLKCTCDPYGHSVVSLAVDNLGNAIPVDTFNVMEALVSNGCPCCGCANIP